MPTSSEAVSGEYSPIFVPEQNYKRFSDYSINNQPNQTVNVDVSQLTEIASTSVNANNTSDIPLVFIVGSLVTLAVLAIAAGVAVPIVFRSSQTASTTIAGSSNSNSATLSASSASAGASTTGNAGSTAGTTLSTTAGATTTTIAAGFSAGGAVLSSTTAWYGYEEVTVNCTANLNNITIIIYVQKTVGATYSGAFSTFWGGTMNQAYVDNGAQVIFTWTIISGQTIQASGSPYRAQAQFSLTGVNQTTTADTYTVKATTTGSVTSTFSGHF